MAFGKPGRPPENRLARQQEIYLAVAPLILEVGAHQLTMSAAARAANLSVGGLYHYFPTKRALLLHGLSWEARDYLCRPGRRHIAGHVFDSRDDYVAACAEHSSRMFEFMRPSARAALDLGTESLQEMLEAGLKAGVWEIRESLRELAPWVSTGRLEELTRAMLRLGLVALLERSVSIDEIRNQLHALIAGYIGDGQVGIRPSPVTITAQIGNS